MSKAFFSSFQIMASFAISYFIIALLKLLFELSNRTSYSAVEMKIQH